MSVIHDPQAPVLAFVGAKGGTGSTLLSSSLAWALAEQDLRVVLLDFDGWGGQAALHLCEHNGGPTVRDALLALDRMDATLLDTLLTPCSPKLRLLPAPRQAHWGPQEPATDADSMWALVRHAQATADLVVLDLPSHPLHNPQDQLDILRRCDQPVVVAEPSLPAIQGARRWLACLDPQDAPRRAQVVINKVSRHDLLRPAQIARTLGLQEPIRVLPRSDAAVAHAVHQGMALGQAYPRDALSRALEDWAIEWRTTLCQRPDGDFPQACAAPQAHVVSLSDSTTPSGRADPHWLRNTLRGWLQ